MFPSHTWLVVITILDSTVPDHWTQKTSSLSVSPFYILSGLLPNLTFSFCPSFVPYVSLLMAQPPAFITLCCIYFNVAAEPGRLAPQSCRLCVTQSLRFAEGSILERGSENKHIYEVIYNGSSTMKCYKLRRKLLLPMKKTKAELKVVIEHGGKFYIR